MSAPDPRRQTLLQTGERLIQTIWVGALWTIGYIVAPALFANLDSGAAGRVAGELFTIAAYLSVACGVLLLLAGVGRSAEPRWCSRRRLIGLIVLVVGIGEWGVRPFMEAARLADGSPGPGFGMWHGIASVLYLIASVGGVWLVVAGDGVGSGDGPRGPGDGIA